jgi:hypothetical protein
MLTFTRHYIEMIIAMFLGMGVLYVPAVIALGAFGFESTDAPALALALMGIAMTVPMVAWMRHRKHGWAASSEMAASMLVPTAGVIVLLAAGAVTDFGTLMTLEHVVMFPSMLFVMLLRYDEYAGAAHAH